MDIYIDGTALAFWYDTWLVLLAFAASLVLTIMLGTSGQWRGPMLLLKVVVGLATLAIFPLAMVRVGLNLAVSDYDALGFISVVGTVVALATGVPYFAKGYLESRRTSPSGAQSSAVGAQSQDVSTLVIGPELTGDETGPVDAEVSSTPDATLLLGSSAEPSAPTAWLHFKSGTMAGQSIPVEPGLTSIGRSEDNDIVLDDAAVSRRHAQIAFDDGQFFMEDTGSAMGTLVEGVQATRTLLASGATLTLGDTEIVFMETESLPPEGATSQGTASPSSAAETMVSKPAETAMAWLAITGGSQKGKTYQLKIGENTVGRGAENDLVIEDNSASRLHAMITVKDDEFTLFDLGSRGSTKVGGKRLEAHTLRSGSTVRVGETTLSLLEVDPGAPVAGPVSNSSETMVQGPATGPVGVLVAQSGPDAGTTFPIVQGDNVIGRGAESAIRLTDDKASRRHALIRREGDAFLVFDLGSRTGTHVDGVRIEGYRLSAGETISLGGTDLVLMRIESRDA